MVSSNAWQKKCGRAALALAFSTLAAIALAHGSPPPANAGQDAARLAAAAGLINAGKLADAAKILEDLRLHDPANIQVLRLLGRAYLRNEQFDQALAVMQEILAKQPGAPQELYGIGIVCAAKHETDAAFEWLGKAKATRRIDMTMIQSDPNLAGLHDDLSLKGVRLALPREYFIGTDQGTISQQIDVIGDQHQVAGTPQRMHSAAGIGYDEQPRAQRTHDADREGDLLQRVAFIAVEPPLHGHYLAAP